MDIIYRPDNWSYLLYINGLNVDESYSKDKFNI